MDRLKGDAFAEHLNGAVEMRAYMFASVGQREKERCVIDWYYRTNGGAANQVVGTMAQYRDLPVMGILHTLIKRQCGE